MENLVSLQFLVILVILSPGFFSCLSERKKERIIVTISKIAKKKSINLQTKRREKMTGKIVSLNMRNVKLVKTAKQ